MPTPASVSEHRNPIRLPWEKETAPLFWITCNLWVCGVFGYLNLPESSEIDGCIYGKNNQAHIIMGLIVIFGGERGIRTLDTL